MDYKEKYEAALERASKLKVQNPFDTVSQMMEHVFPELKESEDEKIRKEIVDFINRVYERQALIIIDEEKDKWISWLKKQGEKKPVWSEEDERIIKRIDFLLYAIRELNLL